MRKLLLAASALALASPVASFAAPTISVVGGFGPMAIPAINNFKSELMGAGFTQYTTSSNLFLTGMAKITYYYMGSESGFFNRFTAGSSSYTETSGGYETKWLSPVLIGTQTYATGGSLAGLLGFSSASVGGLPSPVGSDGYRVDFSRMAAGDESVSSTADGQVVSQPGDPSQPNLPADPNVPVDPTAPLTPPPADTDLTFDDGTF